MFLVPLTAAITTVSLNESAHLIEVETPEVDATKCIQGLNKELQLERQNYMKHLNTVQILNGFKTRPHMHYMRYSSDMVSFQWCRENSTSTERNSKIEHGSIRGKYPW